MRQSPGRYLVWQTPSQPVSVRLAGKLLDRFSQIAAETARAGAAGGLLLGTTGFEGAHLVTIEDWELLSSDFWIPESGRQPERGRRSLETALARHGNTRGGLVPIGFFHTADSLEASEEDLYLMARHFPAAANVLLLLEVPGKGPAQVGVFVWEYGRISEHPSFAPYVLSEMPNAGRPFAPPRREPRRRGLWFALATLCAVITFGVLASVRFTSFRQTPAAPHAPGVLLKVDRAGDGYKVSWDGNSPVLKTASTGVLSIVDGSYQKQVQLDQQQLKSGSLVYSPVTGDVGFSLKVFGARGEPVTESVRVLAPGALDAAAKAPAASTPVTPVPEPQEQATTPPAAAPAAATPSTDATGGFPEPPQVAAPPVSEAPLVSAEAKPSRRAARSRASGSRFTPPRTIALASPEIDRSTRSLLRDMKPAEVRLGVRVRIDSNGKVVSAAPVDARDSLHRALAGPALEAARRWQFHPATLNGVPVTGESVITFRFTRRGVR